MLLYFCWIQVFQSMDRCIESSIASVSIVRLAEMSEYIRIIWCFSGIQRERKYTPVLWLRSDFHVECCISNACKIRIKDKLNAFHGTVYAASHSTVPISFCKVYFCYRNLNLLFSEHLASYLFQLPAYKLCRRLNVIASVYFLKRIVYAPMCLH